MRRGFYSRADFDALANTVIGERAVGGVEQAITTVTAAQNYMLGAKKQIGQSIYRYGLAGAVNLVLGELCQAPVPTAGEHNLVPAANYAVGTKVVTLTTGAAVTANEYAGGWLFVNTGAGLGMNLRILSHPANAGAAICAFTLIDPVTTAFAASTRCALTANPYNLPVITTVPPASNLVGVPVAAINAGLYGWFQTRGPASVLTDGTVLIYQQVMPSIAFGAGAGVAGAVVAACLSLYHDTVAAAGVANGAIIADSAGAETAMCRLSTSGTEVTYDVGPIAVIVGRVMRVEVDTDYSLIFLTLE